MIASIIKIVATTFQSNLPIINILLSIIPFLGSKVAIPYTTNTTIWGTIALSPLHAFLLSAVANIGLILVLSPIHSFIIYITYKKNKTRKKKKNSKTMPALEKTTIIVIIKSIPLIGSYISVLIGAFYLSWWQNIIANIIGSILASMIATLININTSCKIICFLVICLEMLGLTIITLLHFLRNTKPTKLKKSKNGISYN